MIKRKVKQIVERLLRIQIFSSLPHGRDDCLDIRATAGIGRCLTIFDVGANVGQSAGKFREAFPEAEIHCFEPVGDCFERLRKTAAADARICCYRLALGSRDEMKAIFVTPHPTMNSFIEPKDAVGKEIVRVMTLDAFTADNGIERIDLLKIDAEGFDLEVLRGADALLSSGKVAFVLVEVGFHPGDERHVLFDDVRSILCPKGFFLFGIYDQQPEWSGEPRLRYANVCFLNEGALRRT